MKLSRNRFPPPMPLEEVHSSNEISIWIVVNFRKVKSNSEKNLKM